MSKGFSGLQLLLSPWSKDLGANEYEKEIRLLSEKYKKLDELFFHPWLLIDYRNLSIYSSSKSIYDSTGYFPEQFNGKSVEFFYLMFHKEDLLKVLTLYNKARSIYSKLDNKEREGFSVDYLVRVFNRSTKLYKHLKCKLKIILTNTEGVPVFGLEEWSDSLPRNYEAPFWWEISYIGSNKEHVILTDQVNGNVSSLDRLTTKEMVVLKDLAHKFDLDEVGTRQKISKSTLQTHLRNIRKKLDVSSTKKAILLYMDSRFD